MQTTKRLILAAATCVVASIPAASAEPQRFSGYIVCQKLATSKNLLQAPVNVIVENDRVTLARPIFNLAGTYVVDNEIALGSISANGEITVTSIYNKNESSFSGAYSGDLKGATGILRGAQEWKKAAGSETRQCSVAFVRDN